MTFNDGMRFTNRIHDTVGMPKIYIPNNMPDVISEVGTMADLRDGIDYTIVMDENTSYSVQERFRRSKYKHYRDITFRYDKPEASGDTKREFFKIKADLFLYGIVNDAEDDFEWAYMFAVQPVVDAVNNGDIPTQYKMNIGPNDTGFIAIEIDDIDRIGATALKYNL